MPRSGNGGSLTPTAAICPLGRVPLGRRSFFFDLALVINDSLWGALSPVGVTGERLSLGLVHLGIILKFCGVGNRLYCVSVIPGVPKKWAKCSRGHNFCSISNRFGILDNSLIEEDVYKK